jgi:hypothetical protein
LRWDRFVRARIEQLKLREATSGASCGNLLSGPGNEALVQTGDEPVALTYRAVEGVPFLLNARRNVRGTIYVASFAFASAGPTTLVVEVGGTVGNRSVVIAEDEIDYIVTPGTQEVELDIAIPNRLHNRRFRSLHVELYNRGVAPLHGWYLTNNPGSFLTMPILVRRR